MTAVAVSKDGLSLAAGMQDGTTCLYDTYALVEQHHLQRHRKAVTALQFFESRLVSGGEDGSVLLHEVETGKCLMERINVFKAKKDCAILGLHVSEAGVAMALDSLGSLKVYDLWRGEKICRLVPLTGQLPGSATREWATLPHFILGGSEYELQVAGCPCFGAVLTPEEEQARAQWQDQPHRRPSRVYSFRLFDILMETFDGLQNMYRRGYDRLKVIACYSHLTSAQLADKHFEIPAIGAALPPEPKMQRSRRKDKSFSKASMSSLSEVSLSKKASSKRKAELTQQKLHPEKFLFTRKNIRKEAVVRPQQTLAWLRERLAGKEQLKEAVGQQIEGLRQDLEARHRGHQ